MDFKCGAIRHSYSVFVVKGEKSLMRHAARKTVSKVNKGKVVQGTLTVSLLVIHVAK